MRRVLLRMLFWLPIVLWLAVEMFLLRAVFLDCGGWGGGCRGTDCGEVAILMCLWGLPISVPVALVVNAFPIESCSTAAFFIVALSFCVAGVMQWYFILRFYVGGGLSRLFKRIFPNPLFDREPPE